MHKPDAKIRCMRTTLNIDENLMSEVVRLSGGRTKGQAVEVALSEYVRHRKKQELLALRGGLDLAEDWREVREAEVREAGDARP